MHARLPLLESHIYQSYKPGWRPTVVLGGKDHQGWKTAKGKVYPRELCRILAMQYQWYASTITTHGQTEIDPVLQEAIDALTAPWDAYGDHGLGMQADYFQSSAVLT